MSLHPSLSQALAVCCNCIMITKAQDLYGLMRQVSYYKKYYLRSSGGRSHIRLASLDLQAQASKPCVFMGLQFISVSQIVFAF